MKRQAPFTKKSLYDLAFAALIFSVIQIVTSCHNSHETENSYNQIIKIDPSLASNYQISQVFKAVNFLALDNKNGFIGSIDKVLFKNGHYYVLDKDYTNGLYVFNENGAYVRKIGNEGDGPTDYGDINDFTIATIKGIEQVWMLDNANSYLSILKYDLQGKFLAKTKSTLIADFIDYLPSEHLIFSTSNQCNDTFCNDLFTTDLSLNVISKTHKPNKFYEQFWFEPNSPISITNSTTSALSYGQTNIVSVDPSTGKLENDLKIDFGEFGVPKDLLKKYFGSIEGFLIKAQNERLCYHMDNLFNNETSLFLSFKYGADQYYFLQNKASQSSLVIKNIVFDIGVELLLPINVVGTKDDTLLAFLDPQELLDVFEKYGDKINENESELQNLLSTITESSNPIIMKLSFH
ncbi:6-bladed beta-propeller [Roseivirga misakiensis]|uniref:6-bladed beta-propeller n=1 Tax=Roseivirga misakiensis TaxID=1563681 RepID=A0A1E5T7Y3_9BACT|nr:6-bladed beta-propeller [Roseivirga misakiensis]OEK07456.1 hypothetical protein BFP71_00160 [Roseivirga misakiensis]